MVNLHSSQLSQGKILVPSEGLSDNCAYVEFQIYGRLTKNGGRDIPPESRHQATDRYCLGEHRSDTSPRASMPTKKRGDRRRESIVEGYERTTKLEVQQDLVSELTKDPQILGITVAVYCRCYEAPPGRTPLL